MNRITIALLVVLASAHSTLSFAGLYGTIDSVDTLKTVAEQRAQGDDRKIASDHKASSDAEETTTDETEAKKTPAK